MSHKPTPGLQRSGETSGGARDPIEVFCRVRPINEDEESCVEVLSEKIVQLTAPIPQKCTQNRVEQMECTFNKVFTEDIGQEEVFHEVGLPLIEELVQGKNGLCFMYGITGSGKTYTMNGSSDDGGVLPRSLDCIFNTIDNLQTARCVFRPDGYNSYIVVSDKEAEAEERNKRSEMETLMKKIDLYDIPRVPGKTKLNVDSDNRYAVFVSFVEIYNNSVFDLLEDPGFDEFKQPKPPGSKILREDKNKGIFVYQASEVEVKNTEEAFAMFTVGHQRRKTAHTLLNAESSRSHCVFTINLVQAPLGPDGDTIMRGADHINVSQLSLCDLAGSERNSRTHTEGEKARQAGHINNSLMTLRSCIESLRENQRNNATKIVPYRDSKLTHLFRNYFDGAGSLKMIVCLNPRCEDFDESVHVMKFAEMTKEVKVSRAEGVKFDLGLAAGRGKAYSEYRSKAREYATSSDCDSQDDVLAPLQQFPPWPLIEMAGYNDGTTLKNLMQYLEERIKLRETLYGDWQHRQQEVRNLILQLEQDNIDLTKAMEEQRALLSEKEKEAKSYEKRLKTVNEKYEILQRSLHSFESEKRQWTIELEKTKNMVEQERKKKLKIKQTLKDLTSSERLKWEKECQKRVHEKEIEMQEQVLRKNEKLRQLRDVVNDLQIPKENQVRLGQIIAGQRTVTCHKEIGFSATPTNVANMAQQYENGGSATVEHTPTRKKRHDRENCEPSTSTEPTPTPDAKRTKKTRTRARATTTATTSASTSQLPVKVRSKSPPPAPLSRKNDYAPVVGRHRRSKSTDFWLNHKPADTMPTDTIMQPFIRNKKTVKTPEIKDLKVIPHYMLTHQEEDSCGEIETKLIKGEVHATRGGGSSVHFTDIETLKKAFQERATPTKTSETPTKPQGDANKENKPTPKSKTKKRKPADTPSSDGTDVETRCVAGIGSKDGGKPGMTNHGGKKMKS